VELFGACIACQLWKNKWRVLIPTLAVMVSMIPFTGSRQSILTATALLTVGILYAIPRPKRWKYGTGILLLGIVLGGLMLNLHPRMQDVNISDVIRLREISSEHNIRFNIWGAALQNPSDYLLYGLGGGQSGEYIYKIFQAEDYYYLGEQHFHPHNQFLTETMEIGVFGLLLFLAAWVSIPLCASNRGKKTAVLFTVLFAMNMLTDCMFAMFDGIALWAVGLLFILLQSHAESEE
jgi:O-antigen ligase